MTTSLPGAPVGAYHLDFDATAWVDERSVRKAPIEMIEQAERLGAKRKRMATGEGGFHMTYNTMPADYRIQLHRHGHNEMIVVLEGGATVDGAGDEPIVLEARDAIVVEGGFEYGFTCGSEGMTFLTIRMADSTVTTA